jgi:hypothetical protein
MKTTTKAKCIHNGKAKGPSFLLKQLPARASQIDCWKKHRASSQLS